MYVGRYVGREGGWIEERRAHRYLEAQHDSKCKHFDIHLIFLRGLGKLHTPPHGGSG